MLFVSVGHSFEYSLMIICLSTKGAKLVPTTKRCPKSKTLRMTRMLNVDEKARALQRASGFKTESPCFKVVLQPSYICRGCKMVSFHDI